VQNVWREEFSNGSLGARHYGSDSVMIGLVSSHLRKYSWPCHTEVARK